MVIISNGFSKFHLSVAAAEIDRRHLLSCFLTGAYPTPLIRKILSLPILRASPKLNRLVARREEITDSLVHAHFSSEALHITGAALDSEAIYIDSLRLYGWSAIRHVERAAARGACIYHYRAGMGGKSVEVARKCGMFILCDHSIAHPAVLEAFVKNKGKMPDQKEGANSGPSWNYVLRDIEQADAVLVNSHFVKDTFEYAGHDGTPVHVIYLGVDDAFLANVPQRENGASDFSMLFAGNFNERKGAETLIEALRRLDHLPWKLEIAGLVDAEISKQHRDFFANPRVKQLGILSRRDLARTMARANVFVFPSYAEGSARVVFEALACGCYVITTPNSGSIVEQGVHGSVVPPGNSSALADAIQYAYSNRDEVLRLGRNNAQLIRAKYRQSSYGEELLNLYQKVLGGGDFGQVTRGKLAQEGSSLYATLGEHIAPTETVGG